LANVAVIAPAAPQVIRGEVQKVKLEIHERYKYTSDITPGGQSIGQRGDVRGRESRSTAPPRKSTLAMFLTSTGRQRWTRSRRAQASTRNTDNRSHSMDSSRSCRPDRHSWGTGTHNRMNTGMPRRQWLHPRVRHPQRPSPSRHASDDDRRSVAGMSRVGIRSYAARTIGERHFAPSCGQPMKGWRRSQRRPKLVRAILGRFHLRAELGYSAGTLGAASREPIYSAALIHCHIQCKLHRAFGVWSATLSRSSRMLADYSVRLGGGKQATRLRAAPLPNQKRTPCHAFYGCAGGVPGGPISTFSKVRKLSSISPEIVRTFLSICCPISVACGGNGIACEYVCDVSTDGECRTSAATGGGDAGCRAGAACCATGAAAEGAAYVAAGGKGAG
jgi:hypothetical protein